MEKRRVMLPFEKLSPEVKEQLKVAYPNGFKHKLQQISVLGKDPFFALTFENEDTRYLIKVKQDFKVVIEHDPEDEEMSSEVKEIEDEDDLDLEPPVSFDRRKAS